MLSLALLSVLAAAEPAPAVTLTVDIARGGAVSWTDAPCRLEARRGAEVIASGEGPGLEVTPGPTLVVVTCDAKEGSVRRSQRVDVKKAQTLKLPVAPGTVVAVLDKDGTKSAGRVVVYDDNDVEVAAGADKAPLLVDAGKKRVVGLIERGSGRPLQGETTLTVKTAAQHDVVVDVADGELVVTVTENGRPAKAVIALRAPGETKPLMELPAGETTSVPAGTWELVTQLAETHDFKELITRSVVVTARKKTTRAVNHTTGTVTIKTTPPTGVLVELFRPDEAQAFNQLDPGTSARLTPGRYLVKATLEGRILDDGTPPTTTVTTTVAGSSTVNLTPVVADVDVAVVFGKTPRALPVSLTVPGAAKPFIVKAADAAGSAAFAVSPQKVEVSARLDTAHGPIEVKKLVDVRGGKNKVLLAFDRGSVVHQVNDAGAAAIATVRYTPKPAKKGAVPGEPLVTVKAGETAWLPPGVYLVEVERLGERRPFGEVKVVAGTTVEGVFEWAPPPAPTPAAPTPAAPTPAAPTTPAAPAASKPAPTSAKP
jgi:hypothetical protein